MAELSDRKADESMDIPLTQRAYTLRLSGDGDNRGSWREALWKTHEAVNRGAKVFGDWLLTLRGGLSHELAKAATPEERHDRRIVLALSWLSVESRNGAPPDHYHVVGSQTKEALRAILRARSLADGEIESWITDCEPSVTAAIREDAVWVNRSRLFDEFSKRFCITHTEAQEIFFHFFGPADDYLKLPSMSSGEEEGRVTSSALVPDTKFATIARGWLSSNWGAGKKTNTALLTANLQRLAKEPLEQFEGRGGQDLIKHLAGIFGLDAACSVSELTRVIGWTTGRDSRTKLALRDIASVQTLLREKLEALQRKAKQELDQKSSSGQNTAPWASALRQHLEDQIGISYRTGRDLIGEFANMLDHAARRVGMASSWVKRTEATRRRFTEDALKMEEVPADAQAWLEAFCEERSTSSGSVEGYIIRRRAVGRWKDVVQAWSAADCLTEEDRVAAARALQDIESDDKFGDIQLFEAMAAEEAKCVWKQNGHPSPEVLLNYVAGVNAQADQLRFKVPAYRHPDPLLHPVFCEFGKSRWKVRFAVHQQRRKPDSGDNTDFRDVAIDLWDGSAVSTLPLSWRSKRLRKDLALCAADNDAQEVTRADRLGRAAAGLKCPDPVSISSIFEEQEWNARLQTPRQKLDAMARVRDNSKLPQPEKERRLAAMRSRLPWLLTFSPRLQPQGPWLRYLQEQSLTASDAKLQVSPKGERDEWRGLAYPFWHTANEEGRVGMAKHLLSRLPGLRILSVDLGHRFAAACAAWQTLSRDEMLAACAAAKTPAPAPETLWMRLRDAAGKHPTTYRRLGPDTLPDGSAHPAPWARLDRQFAIRLQGEDRRARPACSDETQAVVELEKALGFTRAGDIPERIDELMAHAVRIAKLGLRRHGDCARIAFAFTADHKPMPGDRKEWFARQPGDTEERARERHENHAGFVQDALLLWHELATSARWEDGVARNLWNDQILPIVKDLPAPSCLKEKKEDDWRQVWKGLQSEAQRRPEKDDENTPQERRQRRTERELVRELLKPVAERLIADSDLRTNLHNHWRKHWQDDDGAPARVKPEGKETRIEAAAAGWYVRLRWLNRRLLPRESDRHTRNIQDVGGLSLTRIATIRSLYQLQKAFFTRLHPDGKREVAREGFADEILQKMERMREQRVKQLASRIVEAALGVGIEQPRKHGRQPKRPTERIADPRFAPCHAVVIENLTNYTPDELRTRLENRRLMDWSAGQVRKYLTEACQLHGLHLRQVSAHFTSRQDSRSGAPGLRCAEVDVKEFLNAAFWKSEVARACKRLKEDDASAVKHRAYDSYLHDLKQHCQANGSTRPQKVLIPRAGGEVFVSARSDSPAASGLDADLNAAANIGLKALLDPDWAGRWWYVPCDAWTYIPDKNRVAGSLAFETPAPLRASQPGAQDAGPRKRTRKQRAKQGVVNLFRDVSAQPMNAEPGCKPYGDYWADVEARVVQRLRAMHGISPLTEPAPVVAGSDDVPF
jgi:hypothetical protein